MVALIIYLLSLYLSASQKVFLKLKNILLSNSVFKVVLSIVHIAKDKNIEIIFNTEEEIITAIDKEKIVRIILSIWMKMSLTILLR